MSYLIKISDDRGEQLRAYAESQCLGIADAIGALLRHAGVNEVPGFNVTPMQAAPGTKPFLFTLAFGDGYHAVMKPTDILLVAEHLDECASMSGTGGKRIRHQGNDGDGVLVIARHRRHSVIISGTFASGKTATRVLTLDVGHDLAEQIRRSVEIG